MVGALLNLARESSVSLHLWLQADGAGAEGATSPVNLSGIRTSRAGTQEAPSQVLAEGRQPSHAVVRLEPSRE